MNTRNIYKVFSTEYIVVSKKFLFISANLLSPSSSLPSSISLCLSMYVSTCFLSLYISVCVSLVSLQHPFSLPLLPLPLSLPGPLSHSSSPPLPPLSLPRSATFGVRNASTRGRWMCASIASGRGQNRSSTERPTATGSWTGFRPLSTPVRADAFATCQVCAINLSGTVGSIACSGRRYDPRLHR